MNHNDDPRRIVNTIYYTRAIGGVKSRLRVRIPEMVLCRAMQVAINQVHRGDLQTAWLATEYTLEDYCVEDRYQPCDYTRWSVV